ncbi:hypothetical protein I4U23_014588 [Adineta vaga]|nr:hypothetical protein I4U23_014588 [Adineta vaga]
MNTDYTVSNQSDTKNSDGIHSDYPNVSTSVTNVAPPLPPPPPPQYSSTVPPYFVAQPPYPGAYQPSTIIVTQGHPSYQGVLVPGTLAIPQTAFIRDYLVWSIINVFLGGFLLGIVAVVFSILTRTRKQEGDLEGARTMSKITLVVNILITIVFFIMTAFLIVYFVAIASVISSV